MADGLPIPKPDNVLAQAPGILSIDAGAHAWGQIATAGAKIAQSGFDTLQLAEHQAQVGYLAEQEVEIARKRTELRDQFSADPAGFDAAWKGYTDGKLAEVQPRSADHVKKVLGSQGNAAYSAILGERRAKDQRLDGERTAAAGTLFANDVIGAAMAGGDILGKSQKYRNFLQSTVTSGLHTQEWADLHWDDTLSKAEGETAAREGVRVYREEGFDAAVGYLKKNILENENLQLKGESKYKAFSRGLSAIRLQKSADSEDRAGVVAVSKEIRNRLDSNQPVDPAEVRDASEHLTRTGAAKELHLLTVSSAVAEATAPYRSGLNLREFAGAVSGQRNLVEAVKRFEGYTPQAKWDFKQYSSGYGTKGAPGEVVDRATAEARLTTELGRAASIVDQAVPNLPPGARDAMISLTFNSGADWVNSGLGERLRAGDMEGAKQRFVQYNRAGGEVNEGLAKRRAEEVQWFDRGGAGGDSPLPGVPPSGEITKRVQQVFVAQARKSWPEFEQLIKNGKVLDGEDFNAIRYAAALSGDSNWQDKVEAYATAHNIITATAKLPEGQRQTALDQTTEALRNAGLPAVTVDTINTTLKNEFDRQNKAVRESPVDYAIERGAKPPDQLDFSSGAALKTGIDQRVAIARGVATDQQVPVATPFRASDRATLAGAIASGDPQRASAAFTALASLPDDILSPALHSTEIKEAVLGAARSADPARYNAAMVFLDQMWAKAPETTKALFTEESIHSLMTWQTNLRYMTPEQLAKDRERTVQDPQVVARRKVNETKGQELARELKYENIVGQFDTSYGFTPGPIARALGSQPLAPTDQLTRDSLMGDFETLYKRRYADTLDKDVALKQTVDLMKTKWQASAINGGRLMLNAPEQLRGPDGNPIYPAVNGSYSWMTKQLESAIAAEVGKPRTETLPGVEGATGGTPITSSAQNWNYTLVPDRQTAAEAQRGLPASYNVVVVDAATGKSSVLPRRFAWDVTEDVAKARVDFEQQRARMQPVDDAIRAARAEQAQMLSNAREAVRGQ